MLRRFRMRFRMFEVDFEKGEGWGDGLKLYEVGGGKCVIALRGVL